MTSEPDDDQTKKNTSFPRNLFYRNDTIPLQVFNKHAPIKYKYIRANNNPFMTKAIMLWSKLLNTPEANLAYKRQRNICTSLLRKNKRTYYGNLNPSIISDNKKMEKERKKVRKKIMKSLVFAKT